MFSNRVVVVGASAGGIGSLIQLVKQLPADLPAAVLMVQHLPPHHPSDLPAILSRAGALKAVHPVDGETLRDGRIYVAPPDRHLLIEDQRIAVKRGPKENRFRPSVDALFRSAAYTYGERAIGVVLSGALDDGTSGLWSIKRLGGVTVIQDPADAQFDSMPISALEQVEIDHIVPAGDMGALIASLLARPTTPISDKGDDAVRKRLALETSISANGDAFAKGVTDLGEYTPFTCPECEGVLVRIKEEKNIRFRCHTGHGLSREALLYGVVEKVEMRYWDVMRSLEEAAMLLEEMGHTLDGNGQSRAALRFRANASQAAQQSRQVRELVMGEAALGSDTLMEEVAVRRR